MKNCFSVFNKLRIVLILFCIFILTGMLACSKDGGGGDTASQNTDIKKIERIISSACLQSSNADAEVNYYVGNNQVKNLVWNCASYPGKNDLLHIEEFYIYDDNKQCFTLPPTNNSAVNYETVADCTTPAQSPESPLFAISVSNVRVEPFQLTREPYYLGFTVFADIENIGNVAAMGLSLTLRYDYIDPNPNNSRYDMYSPLDQDIHIGPSEVSKSSWGGPTSNVFVSGGEFNVTVMVSDYFGNELFSGIYSTVIP